MAAGLGMVHQHFMLCGVHGNRERHARPRADGVAGLLDRAKARDEVSPFRALRLPRRPRRYGRGPAGGVQQRVEIIKALVRNAKVSSSTRDPVHTPQETDELMGDMRGLRSPAPQSSHPHKLREVQAVADRITVIRACVVGTDEPPRARRSSLDDGGAPSADVERTRQPAALSFRVRGLTVVDDRQGRSSTASPSTSRRRDPRGRRRAGQRPERAGLGNHGLQEKVTGSIGSMGMSS